MTAAELLRQLLDLAAGALGIDSDFLGVVQIQRDIGEVNHAMPSLSRKRGAGGGEAMSSDLVCSTNVLAPASRVR
jgi:hypothetical protein